MTDGRRPTDSRWSVTVAVLVGAALGAVTNIFTNTFPADWEWAGDWKLMGAIFVLCLASAVGIAVIQQSRSGPGSTVRTLLNRLTSRYERDYRHWVSESRRNLDAKGLNIIGPFIPELDASFVRLALTSKAPGQVGSGMVPAGRESGRDHSIWHFLDRRERVVLAVLGAPGSGKTTLLSHVARRTAGPRRERKRPIPVWLQLRDQAHVIVANPNVSLPSLIRGSAPDPVGPGPDGWWERQLRAGRCVVLLDGLDETGEAEVRRDVTRWINTQIAAHQANDFVVTSRPHGYRDAFVDATETVQILPFDRAQVSGFLEKWYTAAERHDADHGEVAAAVARGREAAVHLLGQIDAIPGLADLTANPLLLTMIANVHRYGRQLPENRAMLYREVCETTLGRRDEAKGQAGALRLAQRMTLLGRLAYEWMRQGIRGQDRRALLRTVRPWLDETAPEITNERFLADMERTGLLLALDLEHFAFTHQTFQEYLAAAYIAETGQGHLITEVTHDPWWRETILLYAAVEDPNPIVASALRSGALVARSLAFEIAESNERVDRTLRGELDRLLRHGLRPGAEAAARTLALDVLIGRLLRAMVITSTGGRVGLRPITTELYEAFCSETGIPLTEHPAAAGPGAPALGIWRADAEAFVRWINGLIAAGPRSGSGIILRLPTGAEVLAARPGRPVWITEGSRCTLWHPPGHAPGAVMAGAVTGSLDADLAASALLAEIDGLMALWDGEVFCRSAKFAATVAGRLVRVPAASGIEPPSEPETRRRVKALMTDLRRDVERLHAGADELISELRQTRLLHPDTAARIKHALRKVDLGPAMRSIQQTFDSDVLLAVPAAARVHEQIENLVAVIGRIRSLLAENAPVDLPRSTADRILETISLRDIGPPPSPTAAGATGSGAARLLPARLPEHDLWLMDLSDLAARLKSMPSRIAPQLTGDGFVSAVDRLLEVALPILDRELPITPESAAAVRAPALILARIAQQAYNKGVIADLIELAAATCMLEERRRRPEILEALILAHD